jgi:crotonobetainyl-CoA:carnitine CoA-transferase CaiB-like acyl-CoA transferase
MLTRTNAEWQERLEAVGVPCAPMQTIDQVLAHEQTRALGIVQPSPDGRIALVGLPLSFDGERPPFRLFPPELGAHTAEVLGPIDGLGFSGFAEAPATQAQGRGKKIAK